MKQANLIPVDIERCQAEKQNGVTWATLGGCRKMIRCTNSAAFVITESEPGDDGKFGSMSMCVDCINVASAQLNMGDYIMESIKK